MSIEELRKQIDDINLQILDLLSRRGSLVCEIANLNMAHLGKMFDPKREQEMLNRLTSANKGPYPKEVVAHLFKEIFKASLVLKYTHSSLLYSRAVHPENTVITVNEVKIGGGKPVMIAGPCSVESEQQIRIIAQELKKQGVGLIRGGAFKPRTSPYTFQGLGKDGLIYLSKAAREAGLASVSEVIDPRDIDLVAEYCDILQIGARSMGNFALLKEAGRINRPILLKRGMGATIEEFLYAAEYILFSGNKQVMMCERGIRTFEHWSRNTLDITAVAIIKQMSHLPVIVDVSHSSGRRDLVLPLARASIAAGADGIMVEVHNTPESALSDPEQQLNFDEFHALMQGLKF